MRDFAVDRKEKGSQAKRDQGVERRMEGYKTVQPKGEFMLKREVPCIRKRTLYFSGGHSRRYRADDG